MKTIIALRGDQNTGKSQTIGLLYNIMIRRGFNILRARRNYSGEPSRDFIAIFEIKKIKIGITTYGDTPSKITETISYLINEGCKIIVCACHRIERGSNGGNNPSIIQFTDYRHRFIEKTVANTRNAQCNANQNDANELLRIIES